MTAKATLLLHIRQERNVGKKLLIMYISNISILHLNVLMPTVLFLTWQMHDKSEVFFFLSLSPTLFLSPHKLLFLILNQVLSWVSRLSPQMACCSVPSLQEIRKSSWLFRSKVDALTFCLTHRYVKLSFTLLKNASARNWYFKNNMHNRVLLFISFLRDFQLPIQRHLHPAWLLLNKHAYNLGVPFLQWHLTEGHAKIWFILKCISVLKHILFYHLRVKFSHSFICFCLLFYFILLTLLTCSPSPVFFAFSSDLRLSLCLLCLSLFLPPSISVYHFLSHLLSSNKCDL